MCNYLKCAKNAVCVARNHVGKCTCPVGGLYKGDPIHTGCRKVECINNDDCRLNELCDASTDSCVDVCSHHQCGVGAVCTGELHAAVCRCPPGLVPSPSPNVRCTKKTSSVEVCPTGQCQTSCNHILQCAAGQTCGQGGVCISGCVTNADCASPFLCIDQRCQDPCSVTCGPNSLCRAEVQGNVCQCPSGFAGVPTAQQGCVRIPEICSNGNCHSGFKCHRDYCMPTCQGHGECARGEQCNNGICLKVCRADKNCLQGEICQNRICQPGCRQMSDCRQGEECRNGQCRCKPGHRIGTNGCQDEDECANSPCPSQMTCVNTIGAYECKCPAKMISDGNGGCRRAHECLQDSDCEDHLGCINDPAAGKNRCMNPCEFSFCTPKATCSVIGHKPFCSCPPRHRGDPTDASIGCYQIECESNSECAPHQKCDLELLRCYGKITTSNINKLVQLVNRTTLLQTLVETFNAVTGHARRPKIMQFATAKTVTRTSQEIDAKISTNANRETISVILQQLAPTLQGVSSASVKRDSSATPTIRWVSVASQKRNA